MTTTQTSTTSTGIRPWLGVIIAGLFAVAAVVVASVMAVSHNQALTSADETIAELSSDLAVKQAALETQTRETNQGSTGVDGTRKAADDQEITAVMKTALSWSSWADYSDARSALMDQYGIDPDSDFLTVFMPEVKQQKDATGKNYNVIDAEGYNSTYKTINTRVIGIHATDYEYLAIVEAGHEGVLDASGTAYYAVRYSIDSNHELVDISIDTVPAPPMVFA